MQARRRAAVFGASGGIGAALVAALGARGWMVAAGSRRGAPAAGAASAFVFDLLEEDSIAAAAGMIAADPPELVVVATGALILADGTPPEKSYRQLTAAALVDAFRINTVGPALVAKHLLPLLPRERDSVFAVLGARVGSIADNRLGGWHSYRASKAGLAMMVRTLAIEHARTHPLGVVVGLHPGTVATRLSEPFRKRLPAGQVVSAERAAEHLLAVIDGLGPANSGTMIDWRGMPIPP